MTSTVISRRGVPIRLTDERWSRIVEEHSEVAGLREEIPASIGDAERIMAGGAGELLAIRTVAAGKALVVVSREVSHEDGFIIAAFFSPHRCLWSSYDAQADVLHINFKKPAHATDSELTDDDVIIRYEGDEIIGLTILHAGAR